MTTAVIFEFENGVDIDRANLGVFIHPKTSTWYGLPVQRIWRL